MLTPGKASSGVMDPAAESAQINFIEISSIAKRDVCMEVTVTTFALKTNLQLGLRMGKWLEV